MLNRSLAQMGLRREALGKSVEDNSGAGEGEAVMAVLRSHGSPRKCSFGTSSRGHGAKEELGRDLVGEMPGCPEELGGGRGRWSMAGRFAKRTSLGRPVACLGGDLALDPKMARRASLERPTACPGGGLARDPKMAERASLGRPATCPGATEPRKMLGRERWTRCSRDRESGSGRHGSVLGRGMGESVPTLWPGLALRSPTRVTAGAEGASVGGGMLGREMLIEVGVIGADGDEYRRRKVGCHRRKGALSSSL